MPTIQLKSHHHEIATLVELVKKLTLRIEALEKKSNDRLS
jgi:hypothetical protein